MNLKKEISIHRVLVVIWSAFFHFALSAQDGQPMSGEAAYVFTLQDLDGNAYSLNEMRGKYVVIHFAATWCPFCNAEAPHLEQVYQKYRGKGVVVFIIDVREEAALVRSAFSRFNFSFPVLLDTDGMVAARYAPEGVQPALERYEVPIASNLIIDKTGTIIFYSLLNTAAFDARLSVLQQKLDDLISNTE